MCIRDRRPGKSLVPTAKGLEVYDIVRRMRIADVEMTGMWELALGKIASGEIRPVTFTSSIDIYTRQIVAELLSVQITRPEYVSCPCPKMCIRDRGITNIPRYRPCGYGSQS